MSDPSTLEEFISEYNELHYLEAAEVLKVDMFAELPLHTILQFAGDCWVIQSPDKTEYFSYVERYERHGTLEEVATWVYFEWYVSECVTPTEQTMAWLTRLLADWCKWTGYEHKDAHEILADITAKEPDARTAQDGDAIVWLEWFINAWLEGQLRSDLEGVL